MNPRKFPATRPAINHKFVIAGVGFYATFGMYEDGSLGEIFIKPQRSGSNPYGGLIGALALTASMALQRGVPIEDLVKKWEHTRYEPMGPTNNPKIPMASSPTDYIAKLIRSEFLEKGKVNGEATPAGI